ncbi:MAG: thioredoxin family protein [Pseudobacteriovorax sp.]|nr:thioredoxin family protein [Pseudobacteriovorax sp.]
MLESKATNKPIFIYFAAKWCPSCVQFETNILSSPNIQEALKDFVLVWADVDEVLGQEILDRGYPNAGTPGIFYTDATGDLLLVAQAPTRERDFLAQLNASKSASLHKENLLEKSKRFSDEEWSVLSQINWYAHPSTSDLKKQTHLLMDLFKEIPDHLIHVKTKLAGDILHNIVRVSVDSTVDGILSERLKKNYHVYLKDALLNEKYIDSNWSLLGYSYPRLLKISKQIDTTGWMEKETQRVYDMSSNFILNPDSFPSSTLRLWAANYWIQKIKEPETSHKQKQFLTDRIRRLMEQSTPSSRDNNKHLVWLILAAHYWGLDDLDSAYDANMKAIEAKGGWWIATANLSNIARKKGDRNESQRLIKESIAQARKDGIDTVAMRILGILRHSKGSFSLKDMEWILKEIYKSPLSYTSWGLSRLNQIKLFWNSPSFQSIDFVKKEGKLICQDLRGKEKDACIVHFSI